MCFCSYDEVIFARNVTRLQHNINISNSKLQEYEKMSQLYQKSEEKKNAYIKIVESLEQNIINIILQMWIVNQVTNNKHKYPSTRNKVHEKSQICHDTGQDKRIIGIKTTIRIYRKQTAESVGKPCEGDLDNLEQKRKNEQYRKRTIIMCHRRYH